MPNAPTGLTASGGPIPTLSWTRDPAVGHYRVQGSEDATFSNRVFELDTRNDRYTPARVLRSGTLYWRVQAVDHSGSSSWSQSETRVGTLRGPSGLSWEEHTLQSRA